VLPGGKVLVAGGRNANGSLSSAELFDPVTGNWVSTGSLKLAHHGHTATLLSNGKVLLAGGVNASGILGAAELYDPATELWTLTGPLITARDQHTATLLPQGQLLIAGGDNSGYLSSAELYDVGLGFLAAWQPRVKTLTSPVALGGSLTLVGSGFRGFLGGSGGNTQDSPADYPLVQLRSLESGQTLFLPATNWSGNLIISAPLRGLPPGYALATVFVNGIPSTVSILNVSAPIATPATVINARTLANGSLQFAFTNTPGSLFCVLATTNPTLPMKSWTVLGRGTEISPGHFQFTDPTAANIGQRFYRVCYP
jgi:hypothetical protein